MPPAEAQRVLAATSRGPVDAVCVAHTLTYARTTPSAGGLHATLVPSSSRACVRPPRATATGTAGDRPAVAHKAASGALSLALAGAWVAPALAAPTSVGAFNASGLFFKDKVEVFKVTDLNDSVSLYVSDFKRSLGDKISGGDPFSEPSTASVGCVVTDPSAAAQAVAALKPSGEGDEVYSEDKGINLGFGTKTLRIRRLVDVSDPQHPSLVYVSYSTRPKNASEAGEVSSGRYKTSVCALTLPGLPAPAPSAK